MHNIYNYTLRIVPIMLTQKRLGIKLVGLPRRSIEQTGENYSLSIAAIPHIVKR